MDTELNEILVKNHEHPLILNLAGGKMSPLFLDMLSKQLSLILNVDKMYNDYTCSFDHIINSLQTFFENKEKVSNIIFKNELIGKKINIFYSEDIFSFLNKFPFDMDIITIYRFLEHVPRRDLLFFIYLLSTITRKGSMIDIIVPDYKILATRILDEDPFSSDFEKDDIITSTELLNEPEDPHQSIWTAERARKYFKFEGRFKIIELRRQYEFDGRDIYMRFIAERL